jgi:hypothetical protein
MSDISIFAQRAFLNTDPRHDFVFNGSKPKAGYLKRVSSIIRADQITEAIGAKLNPKSGYESDICIYVKPGLDKNGDLVLEGKSAYLDIVDEIGYLRFLQKYPDVSFIVVSEHDYLTLAATGLTKNIFLIPQQHCNFERVRRTRKEVTTVGVVGNHRAFPYLPPELKSSLSERGMELLEFSDFFTRQDIIDFYQKIDIQIVWRPYRKKMANPLKIVNAASFGIPTIALDEIYFKEMGHCYIGVADFGHFLSELDRLRSSETLYQAYAELCLKKAEEYHIENIAKLYLSLK